MFIKRIVLVSALLTAACGNDVQGEPGEGRGFIALPTSSAVTPGLIPSWAAEYYATTNLAGPPLKRMEQVIDFDWGRGAPDPSIGGDGFSARWTGILEAPVAATYDFSTTSDDGLRVLVDGRALIDLWNDHAATAIAGSVSVAAGEHRVTVEYYESGGDAVARVEVTRHSLCDPTVPPPADPVEQPGTGGGSATAYNILVRGQSNALLFVSWGGVWALRSGVAGVLGVDEGAIKIFADWAHPQGHNTINSGSGFIGDWMDGAAPKDLENGLLAAIADMSDADKANPTLVLWMHNEYDQQHQGLDEATWLTAARSDGRLVREALGVPASRSPYFYVWVPYGYASPGAAEAVWDGMHTLVDDPGFNAVWGTPIQASDMGDASHMSDQASEIIGARIAPEVAEVLGRL